MIKRTLLAVCIGVLNLLFFIQFDPHTHSLIEQYAIAYINQHYQCSVQGRVDALSLFFPTIVCKDVKAASLDADWEGHCTKLTIRFSWLDLFNTQTIPIDCIFDQLQFSTQMKEYYPAIATYIEQQFFTGSTSSIATLKSLSFYKSLVHCTAPDYSLVCELNSQSKRMKDNFRTNVAIKDGHLVWRNKKIMQQIHGALAIDVADIFCNPQYTVTPDLRTCIMPLTETTDAYKNHCFITGRWEHQHGRFQVHNNDHTVMINPIIVSYENKQYHAQVQGVMPVHWISRVVDKPPLNGQAHVDLQMILNDLSKIKGCMIVEDLQYGNYPGTCVLKTVFEKQRSLWKGDLTLRGNAIGQCSGAWQWNEQDGTGAGFLDNQDFITIPYCSLTIAPNAIHCSVNILNPDELTGSYSCQLTGLDPAGTTIEGTFNMNSGQCEMQGNCQADTFTMRGDLNAPFFITAAEYRNQDGQPLITIAKHDAHWYTTMMQLSVMRTLVSKLLHYELQEEGALHAAIYTGDKQLFGKIYLSDDSSIRLPETYNFIKNFSCWWRWDIEKQLLRAYQLQATLHAGSLFSKEILIHPPTRSYYVPLIFQQCLFNSLHDLFAIVSGSLIIQKEQDTIPCVKTDLIIERAQLKENIFSSYWQKKCAEFMQVSGESQGPVFDYQLTCQSKDPIRIDTPFLQTDAYVDVQVIKKADNTSVQGAVRLPTGLLRFPYKPLHINHCMLSLNSDIQSPLIDLVASNRIRNYDVRLNVSGSLQDHCVLLSANPPLTQEQILGLLLIGSSQDSFNTLMPALLMNNLRNLLFGSIHTDIFNQFFTSYVRPFSINLIPSFTDQTGRGGLRGAIEITVNDRLRAMIQKNFSLTEDTRYELEYAVTDDITVRAIRDERSDIGAEIEMRWKF